MNQTRIRLRSRSYLIRTNANSRTELAEQTLEKTWHHIAIAADGTAIRLYIDGAHILNDYSNPNTVINSEFRFGQNNSIDELAIYPTVLTPDQIAEHWALGQ